MKTIALLFAFSVALLAQDAATIRKQVVEPTCSDFLEVLTSNCGIKHIQVMAHPSAKEVIGFLIVAEYKDYQGFGPRKITYTTFERNSGGDFILSIPLGDVKVSVLELYRGQYTEEVQ